MKKLSKKNKKILITILCIISIILIGLISALIYIDNKEKEMVKEIKSHYNNYVVTTKNTKIYNKNGKMIGKITKNFVLELDKIKINSSKDKYFKIKDKDFYIYYDDIKKSNPNEEIKVNEHYLVFNKNINMDTKLRFYKDNNEVLNIKDKFNLQIKYADGTYYYVEYLNTLLAVKKEDNLNIIDIENTTEKEASYISIINYDTIYENEKCIKDNCIKIDKVKEHLNYLKENNFYTINFEEYNNWLDGKIRLKEKSILLTTPNNNQNVTNLNNENELKIEIISNDNLKFVDVNKTTTKESKKDNLPRYNIKNNTSLENFKKMASGEEVVEVKKIIINQKNNYSNEQRIAVLNYHFFYDPSQGETCNEHICLDVKVFRQQLDYLKNNGYKTLTIEEFTKWMYNEIELPAKSVLITIDDGAMGTGKHNGNKLIPILEEYNMNATLFLISGWWDVNNYKSSNLDVQSHTFDMHQYGSCGKGQVVCASKEALIEDLRKSLNIVDNNNSFCFPFYSYSDLSIQAVQEVGFKTAFIGGNRKATRKDNKFKIPRYPIYNTTSMQQFIQMVG